MIPAVGINPNFRQVFGNVTPNPITSFAPRMVTPSILPGSYVDPQASVIGNAVIDSGVNVAPLAIIRADEGSPIYIGKNSNIQDGVVIHGLKDLYKQHKGVNYSVYVGENTSVAHQSQIHGPAKVGNNVFVGMQAFVFKSEIGDNVVIEPTAKVIGVKIAANKYVPAGEVIKTQDRADNLPDITADYANKDLNHEVVDVNKELARGNIARKAAAAYPANYYISR
jgi:carbonic anhydrase/acetyltransferase-like protein (isoleucine patch superfamily)